MISAAKLCYLEPLPKLQRSGSRWVLGSVSPVTQQNLWSGSCARDNWVGNSGRKENGRVYPLRNFLLPFFSVCRLEGLYAPGHFARGALCVLLPVDGADGLRRLALRLQGRCSWSCSAISIPYLDTGDDGTVQPQEGNASRRKQF